MDRAFIPWVEITKKEHIVIRRLIDGYPVNYDL